MNVYLIGIMGCGKSTLGQFTAQAMKREFIDADKYFEEKEAISISEYFEKNGEAAFRDMETKYLRELSLKESLIISTGGGVILREENFDIMKKSGMIIFIDRPIENIVHDIAIEDRPLLNGGPDVLYSIYAQREAKYKQYCDFHIQNYGSRQQGIEKLAQIISCFETVLKSLAPIDDELN